MAPYWSTDRYNVGVGLVNSYSRSEMIYYDELTEHGIAVHMIGKKRRGRVDLTMPRTLCGLLRDLDIHILHTHNISSQYYAKIAGMIARTPILVFHQHNCPTTLQLRLRSLEPFFKQPDLIVAVSHEMKRALTAIHSIAHDQVVVIHNGTGDSGRDSWCTEGNTVFTVTRLVPEKGLTYLIDAMIKVKDRIPDVKLLILGDGPCRKELEEQAARNGLRDTISFMGFQQYPETLYDKCDVFVLPSMEEGFGLALIEAMSYGKPVVATHVGGIPEVVQDGISGILVPARDPTALANALLNVLSDNGLRRKLALEGKRRSQMFGINKTVNEIENAYQGLVKRKMNLTYDQKDARWARC
jgi:glycosyltransferase involved in cell wall biosynthesis